MQSLRFVCNRDCLSLFEVVLDPLRLVVNQDCFRLFEIACDCLSFFSDCFRLFEIGCHPGLFGFFFSFPPLQSGLTWKRGVAG